MCNKVTQVATRNSLCNGASGGESIGADEPTKFAPCRVSHFQKSDTESVRSPAPARTSPCPAAAAAAAAESEGRTTPTRPTRRTKRTTMAAAAAAAAAAQVVEISDSHFAALARSLHPYFFLSPLLRPSFARGIYSLPSRLDSVPRNRRTTTSERGYCHGLLSIPPSLPPSLSPSDLFRGALAVRVRPSPRLPLSFRTVRPSSAKFAILSPFLSLFLASLSGLGGLIQHGEMERRRRET